MQVKQAITGPELEQFLEAEIRRRARPSSFSPSGATGSGGSSGRMQEWLRAAQESATSIGRMPPVSATWRARAGEVLVRIVKRMLFWYTPQIVSFNTAVVGTLRQLAADLERLERRVAELPVASVPASDPAVLQQAVRALEESGGVAILQTADPEALCVLLEARGLHAEVTRQGPQLYFVTARKPACES